MQTFLLAFLLAFGYVGTTLQAKPTDIHRRRQITENGGKHYYDRGLQQAGVAGTNKTLAPTPGVRRESPAPITPFPTEGPPPNVSCNHVSSNASILKYLISATILSNSNVTDTSTLSHSHVVAYGCGQVLW